MTRPALAAKARITELEDALRLVRPFLDDARHLDFNEDRVVTWIAFAASEIDRVLKGDA